MNLARIKARRNKDKILFRTKEWKRTLAGTASIKKFHKNLFFKMSYKGTDSM